MLLLSPVFFFLVLPISVLLYWKLLPGSQTRLWFLLLFSLGFYTLADSRYLFLLLGLSLLTFLLAGKRVYWVGIAANLAALAAFKLWGANFQLMQEMFSRFGAAFDPESLRLAVPLGLSYYVFKHVGYLIDVNKDRCPAETNWLKFLVYGSLFMEISAGPISNYRDISGQLGDLPGKLSTENANRALIHLAAGIAKKVLLAESLGIVLGLDIYKPAGPNNGLLNIWLLVFLQGLHLYFDFSGYTDIVLGLGYLFGLRLPPNFNSPYLAQNPSQFWQRWHISLSNWFRVYVFSPLSRWLVTSPLSGRRFLAQWVANLVTMGLVGLWHGIGPGFILWGLYHGGLLSVYAWASRKQWRFLDTWVGQVITQVAVFGGWVFFFSTGSLSLWIKLQGMVGRFGFGDLSFLSQIPMALYPLLLIAVPVAFSSRAEAASLVPVLRQKRWAAVLAGLILAFTLLLLGQPSDFSYVQF